MAAPQPSSPKGDGPAQAGPLPEELTRFPPDEEAALLAESTAHKTEANTLFTQGAYADALARYADATQSCPNYLDYPLAVLQSNVAACQLKLQDWKAAISAATAALDKLDRLEAEPAKKQKEEEKDSEVVEEEIVSAGAAKSAPTPTNDDDESEEERARKKLLGDIKRIRYKALMRRARARSEAGGWTNLAGAEEDYKVLAGMDNVSAGDRRIVREQLRALPGRVSEAKERETAEMWGKLKELGNGILKPFGLSTENFQMQQDPNTGGYSMNFKSA